MVNPSADLDPAHDSDAAPTLGAPPTPNQQRLLQLLSQLIARQLPTSDNLLKGTRMSATTPTHLPEAPAWSADPFGHPGKLQPWHHDRLAVVYVRQSSPQQVLGLSRVDPPPYGLVTRAVLFGCGRPRAASDR